MRATGFVNYPTEWWHWSYGDRYWAYALGKRIAFFGAASPLAQ
jgi:D-alanyl-D-alanine dipeptidase